MRHCYSFNALFCLWWFLPLCACVRACVCIRFCVTVLIFTHTVYTTQHLKWRMPERRPNNSKNNRKEERMATLATTSEVLPFSLSLFLSRTDSLCCPATCCRVACVCLYFGYSFWFCFCPPPPHHLPFCFAIFTAFALLCFCLCMFIPAPNCCAPK